jgi:FtsH-binding integral membrane protein
MSELLALPEDRAYLYEATVDVRLTFIRKVYSLFLVSLLSSTGVTAAVMMLPEVADLAGRYSLVFLLLYIGLSWCSGWIAEQGPVVGAMLLSALSVVTGLVFGPTISFYAANVGIGVVYQALGLTSAIFGGLTVYVFVTKQDFSFLRGLLWMGMFAIVAFAVLGMFINFSFELRHALTLAGVLLFIGFILYDTSNIVHHYREDQAIVAAVAIYLDFVILFMKLLRLLSRRD